MSEFHELTFEKGVLESLEASKVPQGFTTDLENWLPEPVGSLRCRTPWKNAVTTGAPSTRIGRGLGHFATSGAYQTIAFVQKASATGTGTSLAVSWPGATTAGNLLILVIAQDATSGTVTPPVGWVQAVTNVAGSMRLTIYYKANASSESGAVTTSFTTGSGTKDAFILEYSGVSTLDAVASTNGTSATVASGTTAATAQSHELWFAAMLDTNNEAQTSPTNGFSQRGNQAAAPYLAVYDKSATATGTASTAATTATSANFTGAIATFKGIAITTPTASGYLIAAHDDTTGHKFYLKSYADLTTGSFSLIETVTNPGSVLPVAFAAGLSRLLYTNQYFSTIRAYDGSTAAEVAGSPAGRCLGFHKKRFFSAGTAAHPSRLWYTELNSYTQWWKTGETSLTDSTNYFDINPDDGDAIEDILPINNGLLIAKRTSMHFFTGTGTSDFDIDTMPVGGGFAGRCLCATPYGAVIAGEDAVYLWSGANPEVISKPIESSYGPTGNFVTTAYQDGIVYICDAGSGIIWAFNIIAGTWHEEKVNSATERPCVVWSRLSRLLMQPTAATTGSLVSYRDFPQARARDANTSMVFRAVTPEMVLTGPETLITPIKLHLQIRQHGGDANQTGLSVTMTCDGTSFAAQTIAPKASARVFRTSLAVGDDDALNVTSVKFAFDQTVASNEQALMDIEKAILEYDVLERGAL